MERVREREKISTNENNNRKVKNDVLSLQIDTHTHTHTWNTASIELKKKKTTKTHSFSHGRRKNCIIISYGEMIGCIYNKLLYATKSICEKKRKQNTWNKKSGPKNGLQKIFNKKKFSREIKTKKPELFLTPLGDDTILAQWFQFLHTFVCFHLVCWKVFACAEKAKEKHVRNQDDTEN